MIALETSDVVAWLQATCNKNESPDQIRARLLKVVGERAPKAYLDDLDRTLSAAMVCWKA